MWLTYRTLGFASSILPLPGVAAASGLGDVFDEYCYYEDDVRFSLLGRHLLPGRVTWTDRGVGQGKPCLPGPSSVLR